MKKLFNFFFSILLLVSIQGFSQFVPVGNGSYTTTFPGVDAANRNTYPSGTPQLSGNAAGKPVPTNDWWSRLIKENHADNLYNYPLAMRTVNAGLVVDYVVPGSGPNGSSQPTGPEEPIVVGVTGLNASQATASDFSDWTVSMNWTNSTHNFTATAGIAMPFLYFAKASADVAQIEVNAGTVVIDNEMLIITDSQQGSDFAVYAPTGSTWTQNGSVYTSTLNGENYWSMAFIPPTASNVATVAGEYKKYAYVFPANTTADWNFNEATSKLNTTFTVTTDVKEGTENNVLLGLLPHQWGHLASASPQPTEYIYSSIRGDIKTLNGNTFTVENTYHGILPTLPYLANYSTGFSPAELDKKISQIENDGLATWTDSYNEGQVMNRLIQTARIADQTGDIEGRDKMVATIKERLEDWLKAESGEIAFIFYYNDDWSALLGYPAGHGQDGNINDHHFHWGYFIHAAAFMEQYEPGWADQWGDMINLLVRDAASPDRNDTKFPFLRNFSPYAGHCWANGFATFPFGNDQESSSESMQFNSSLIHWGTITENDEIRDLGIYLYTTEQTATEEYWFDVNERTFKDGYGFSIASRIWGNGYDNQTFWTGDIAAVYGIEMYPIHGGSLYLGQNKTYVQKLWNEIEANTGILTNEANPNLWHDLMWEYLAFIDPEAAIDLYNSNPDRMLKFGVSDAQTYHWLHGMNALGNVNATITANYPIAAAFDKNGTITYVAHNYSDSPITVTFSDGYELVVPANKMATSKDVAVSGVIASDFSQAYTNGSVNLTATISGTGITKVEFYDGNTMIGSKTEAPYTQKAANLSLGFHNMYAKVFVDEEFNVTNIIPVQVGEQVPFMGTAYEIPGTIETGNYDKFEGGVAQWVSYIDITPWNEGDYREQEAVDAVLDNQEGATIGWINAGEWLEYSIDVQTSGIYDLSFRYASGNENGGGPFYLEIDGVKISNDISVNSTSDWDTWAAMTVSNLEMTAGEHILRLVFINGEFNLGRMTFARTGDLAYSPPVANAGSNVKVLLPETTATLDGSSSVGSEGQTLTYNWVQVYGSSAITFSDKTNVSPQISNLEEGIYKVKLTVSDGTYTAKDEVIIIVSSSANTEPIIAIASPTDNTSYFDGSEVLIVASATDLDGSIVLVEFFNGDTKIGEASSEPFKITWAGATIGNHSITAKATDNGGAVSTSSAITVVINQAPPCSGDAENGDYSYEFSDDKNNPTLTFIPNTGNAGNPTCILYYGTNSNAMAGIGVTPNTPFQLNANEGETIYFYYTYSYNGMEKNTADAKHSYVIGTCSSTASGTNASLSNLTVNGTTVSGFNASKLSYAVVLQEGTTDVPAVSATTVDVDASVTTINNATSLPGTTTILVTAADGFTTKTYAITFSFSLLPTAAPTPPARIATDVVSIFSEAYTNVANSDFNPNWEQTTVVTQEQIAGNNTLKYVNLNYQGVNFGSNIDVTAMEYLHVDLWVKEATTVNVFCISPGPKETPYALTATAGAWASFDIPLSIFSTIVDMSDLFQFKFDDAGSGANATIYLDNIYFYKESIVFSSDATLSDLKVDGTTIPNFDAATMLYTFELANGTTAVPAVTATKADANATVTSITDAAALPGTTTVLVTAEDGSTKTYSVYFAVAELSAIHSQLSDNIKIYINQNMLNVNCGSELVNGTIEIIDISGKLIAKKAIQSTNEQMKINAHGVLIVRITDKANRQIKTKKIEVE